MLLRPFLKSSVICLIILSLLLMNFKIDYADSAPEVPEQIFEDPEVIIILPQTTKTTIQPGSSGVLNITGKIYVHFPDIYPENR